MLTLLLFVVAFVGYLHFYISNKKKKLRLPPGPKGWPLIGSFTGNSHVSLWGHREKYGDITYEKVVGKGVVIFHTADAIREAYLRSKGQFDERGLTLFKKNFVHKDVIFSSIREPYWKKLRRVLQSSLNRYGRGVTENEKVMIKELQHACDVMIAKNGEQFDIADVIVPSICNTIYILLIGERFPHDHPMIKLTHEYVYAYNDISSPAMDEILLMFDSVRHLPLRVGKNIRRVLEIQRQLTGYVLQKLDSDKEGSGLLFDMLELRKDSDWLDIDHIKGTMENFLTAGEITTSMSVITLFLNLLHYPDVQRRVQDEIDDVIGRDRLPAVSDRANMPYAQATIFELFRYSTTDPIPFPHVCEKDANIRDFTIPKGTNVLINLFRIHHDPELWDNPWVFDPTRFLDDSGQLLPSTHPNRSNMLQFGIGARSCVGNIFARGRIFLFLTHFLQRFTFIPGDDLPSCDSSTFVPDHIIHPHPYKLRVVER